MEIKKISSIDKFYKLVSFYNSLSNLYFDLSAYHDNKDIEGYNDVINNIKNIFEFINEYIVENINLDDFIVISEYYENHEYCNEFGVLKCEEFIATKIYCTLKNIYDNNLNCCVIPLIHEKVEQLISESYEEERDNIDDLSEDGLKLYVYKKYESEIKEKAVHEIFINTFNTEVSTETCMCFLMVLESKIKDEKDINLRQKLISIYYNTIFANDNVQLLLITNNFILENYVFFS